MASFIPKKDRGKYKATASGAITNGKPVVINADGTVAAVGVSAGFEFPSATATIVDATNNGELQQVAFDPNTSNKFIYSLMPTGSGGNLFLVTGTISGSTISISSTVKDVGARLYQGNLRWARKNQANQFLLLGRNFSNSGYPTFQVGTVSGATITLGTKVVYASESLSHMNHEMDPHVEGRFIFTYRKTVNDLSKRHMAAGTMSGTGTNGTVGSFGTAVVLNYRCLTQPEMCIPHFNPNEANKFMIPTFEKSGAANNVVAQGESYAASLTTSIIRPGSLSGNAITLHTAVAAYRDGSNSNDAISMEVPWIAYDPGTSGKIIIVSRAVASPYTNSDGLGVTKPGGISIGTHSGNTITAPDDFSFLFGTQADGIFPGGRAFHLSDAPDVKVDPQTAGSFLVTFQYRGGGPVASTPTFVMHCNFSGTTISRTDDIKSFLNGYYQGNYGNLAIDYTSHKFIRAYNEKASGHKSALILGDLEGSIANLTTENYIGLSSSCSFHGTTETYTVTVASGTLYGGGTGNVFYLNGISNPPIQLLKGHTYIFDQANSSNSGHPFHFKNTGGSQYTTGVTVTNSAGSTGAKVTIVIPIDATEPSSYYCTSHGNGMGNLITVENSQATIDIVGTVNKDQSSLTAGQQYFVQENGTLGLTADSTSVIAGRALSATELLVKG